MAIDVDLPDDAERWDGTKWVKKTPTSWAPAISVHHMIFCRSRDWFGFDRTVVAAPLLRAAITEGFYLLATDGRRIPVPAATSHNKGILYMVEMLELVALPEIPLTSTVYVWVFDDMVGDRMDRYTAFAVLEDI